MIVKEDCTFVDIFADVYELKSGDEIEPEDNNGCYFEVFRGSERVASHRGFRDPIVVEEVGPKRDYLFSLCYSSIAPTEAIPPPPLAPNDIDPYFKQKADQGKLQWSLVIGSLFLGLSEVVKVRMFGFQKYGSRDGWRCVSDCRQRYTDALLRHAASYASGERTDPESGLPTLAHLTCDALFLLTLQAEADDKLARSVLP